MFLTQKTAFEIHDTVDLVACVHCAPARFCSKISEVHNSNSTGGHTGVLFEDHPTMRVWFQVQDPFQRHLFNIQEQYARFPTQPYPTEIREARTTNRLSRDMFEYQASEG